MDAAFLHLSRTQKRCLRIECATLIFGQVNLVANFMLSRETLSNSTFAAFVVLLSLILLAGCASGPDFVKPAAPTVSSYTAAPLATQTEFQHFDGSKDIPYDWWTLFRSTQLNTLIERALKANPNLKAAQAVLRQARENVIAQQGFFSPSVSANYSPSANKQAGNASGSYPDQIPDGAPSYYNLHTAQLSVGYVPDVFGLNRRLVESAQAQAEIQRMQLQAAQITLISNLVTAAFQEASLREQIASTNTVISINRENLEILRQQLKLGFVAELDVASQETALAQAEQALPPLSKQLEQTRNLIRALAGEFPNQEVPEFFDLADLHLPEELPLSLPSKLVEQRPDVRAAEAQLHSASAQYGVSIANKMPQFMVTANVGGTASSPDWMLKSGGTFFSLTGNISQLIFDGGTVRAKSRAAEQALVQAGAQYQSTVIAALQNVADTLHAIRSDADAFTAATRAEQAGLNTLKLTRKQFQLGFVSYQTLLAAQQNYQQITLSLTQAHSMQLADTAALYQALGGGWWNQPAAKKSAADKAEGEHAP
jgi:NodT family efflux transporter outer membrane factor (OMF) lipoprotein